MAYIVDFIHFFINHVVMHIPFMYIRYFFLYIVKAKIGKKTVINMNQYIINPMQLRVGKNTNINQGCFLDCRGGLEIGDNVSISHYVKLVTGSHEVNESKFSAKYKKIKL